MICLIPKPHYQQVGCLRHCYITRREFEEHIVEVHVFAVKNDRCRDSPCEQKIEAIIGRKA